MKSTQTTILVKCCNGQACVSRRQTVNANLRFNLALSRDYYLNRVVQAINVLLLNHPRFVEIRNT